MAAAGTVTWGTPVVVTLKDQYDANFDAVLINTDKILCTFGEGASDFMQTATLTVLGTVVSKNSSVQVAAVAYSWKRLCKLNNDKALLAYYTGTTVSLVVVTVTGTVPSYGTIVTQTTSTYPQIVQNGTDKAQLVFCETATSKMRSAVVTVTGTTPTIQASILIGHDINVGYKVNQLRQVATDKFVYWHPWGQLHPFRARDRAKLIMLTVATNTTSIAHTLEYRNTIMDTNIMYFSNLDANNWMMTNHAQRRAAKLTLDLTGNTMTVNDIPYRTTIWDDTTSQTNFMQKAAETNNIQRICDPIKTTNGWAFVATDNNTNGSIYLWTDKVFTFEVYVDDELVGTYTKSMPGVIEGVLVRLTLNRLEVPLKIKNTGAVDLFFMIQSLVTNID
jgi:hypothetical protein